MQRKPLVEPARMAEAIFPAGILDPTSLRRMDLNRIWLRTEEALDAPDHLWFPVNGFEDAARRRGGDHVIADALNLHFRAGEQGAPPPDLQANEIYDFAAGIILLCGEIRRPARGNSYSTENHPEIIASAFLNVIVLPLQPRFRRIEVEVVQHHELVAELLGRG